MIKKGDYYFPPDDLKREAWIKSDEVYQEAAKDPQKFWEKLAGELKWRQKWTKIWNDSHKSVWFYSRSPQHIYGGPGCDPRHGR